MLLRITAPTLVFEGTRYNRGDVADLPDETGRLLKSQRKAKAATDADLTAQTTSRKGARVRAAAGDSTAPSAETKA